MSDQAPESSPIRAAIASVVCNATNWPDRVFPRMLGVDLTVPIDRITAAVRQAYEAELVAAKAEALREAVSEFESSVGVGEFAEQSQRGPLPWGHIVEAWEHQGPYMDWLRNRADKLEAL